MKRVLLTGMSATGKSTLIAELAGRGYNAIDADCDDYSEWVSVADMPEVAGTPVSPERDWVWREDRIESLLSREETDILFLGGCAGNMRRFLPMFDHVVLLSAPTDTIVERLSTRTTNPYGKHPDEVARVRRLIEEVEPLLRRAATHEISTNGSIEDVVADLLRVVHPAG